LEPLGPIRRFAVWLRASVLANAARVPAERLNVRAGRLGARALHAAMALGHWRGGRVRARWRTGLAGTRRARADGSGEAALRHHRALGGACPFGQSSEANAA